jgi:hypothetical protein
LRLQARAFHSGGPVALPDARGLSWCDPTDRPEPGAPTLGAGARRLAAAVLESAVHDVQCYPEDSVPARKARQWIETNERGLYTFLSLCEALDVDPAALRAWVVAVPSAGPHRKVARHVVTR